MEPDSEDIKVAGNVERYVKQPSQLEDWCLAVAQLDVWTRTSNTVQHDTENSSSAEDESTTLFLVHLGHNKILLKHKKSNIIQFVNYKKIVDSENYCCEPLMLYTPWRDEQADLYHKKNTYVESFDCIKHIIQNKMKVYEPMAQILIDAIEDFMREDIPTECDDVAPSTQHEEDQHVILESTQSE